MIRIQDHLNKTDVDAFVSELAENHWNHLNKCRKVGTYYKNSLIERCKSAKLNCFTENYIKKYAENDAANAKRHEKFFDFLMDENYKKLKEIIVAKPEGLVSLKDEIFQILKFDDICVREAGRVAQTEFGKYLSTKIFDYAAYRNSKQCKGTLLQFEFKSVTCPYCNYTKLDITDNNAYFELDHFLQKSQHPFFAVSFFNLIPSCHSCNAIDKGDKSFSLETHVHPFYESFDKIYKFNVLPSFVLGTSNKIMIEKIGNKENDITPESFNLHEKYQNNVSTIQGLIERFNNYKKWIGTDNEEAFIDMLMVGIPKASHDILKYPFSKIQRDVLKEMDVNGILKIE
jgi:hypothetical protein